MNPRFVPLAADAGRRPSAATATAAMVTASYGPDLERCRLLCETADAHISDMTHHYILVERRDVKQFRTLEGPRRTVIDERDILPSWLRPFDDPSSLFRRRIWLSLSTRPLRGWHVQQLRRIAIAAHVAEKTLVYCDSDVAFLRPFEFSRFEDGHRLVLFRRDGALRTPGHDEHRLWSRNAALALGITNVDGSAHDYVATPVAWRRDVVLAMCAQMETVHGRHWVAVIGANRRFSECMLYGRFVEDVMGGIGHVPGHLEFCRMHWTGEPLSDAAFKDFVTGMAPHQVAVGMQSFIGTDIGRIRRLVLGS